MPCSCSSRLPWGPARTHQVRPTPVLCPLPRHSPQEGTTLPPHPIPQPPSKLPPLLRIWCPHSCLPWRMVWHPIRPYQVPTLPHLSIWVSRRCRPLLSIHTLVSTVLSMGRQALIAAQNGRVQRELSFVSFVQLDFVPYSCMSLWKGVRMCNSFFFNPSRSQLSNHPRFPLNTQQPTKSIGLPSSLPESICAGLVGLSSERRFGECWCCPPESCAGRLLSVRCGTADVCRLCWWW